MNWGSKVVTEIIKVIVILIGIYVIINLLITNVNDNISKRLDTIEQNTKQIQKLNIKIDSIKEERVNINNNIDRRTTIINNKKDGLNTVLPKDTNIYNAINFLKDFAK